MHFDYNNYFWSQQTEEYLFAIINSGGLESDKRRAKQELDRRKEEQTEFLEL